MVLYSTCGHPKTILSGHLSKLHWKWPWATYYFELCLHTHHTLLQYIHTTHTWIHTTGARIHTALAYIKDGSITVSTTRGKHFLVASITIRLPIVAIEGTVWQLLVTLDTDKVLDMPRFVHGCDHPSQYRLITSSTSAFRLDIHPSLVHVLFQLSQHAIQLC